MNDNDEQLIKAAEDELETYQLELENRCEQLNTILSLASDVNGTGEVSKRTMMSLETYQPGSLHPDTPLASYTQLPSQQNLRYAQESLNWATVLSALTIAAAVGGMLYTLVKLIGQSKAQRHLNQAVSYDQYVEDIDRDYQDRLSEQNSSKKKIGFTDLVSESHSADRDEHTLLDALKPGGKIAEITVEVAGSLDELLDDLHGRIKKLDELLGNIGSQPAIEIADEIQTLVVDFKRNKAYQRIQELEAFIDEKLEDEQSPSTVIRGQLRWSDEYLEFIEKRGNWSSAISTARQLQDLGIERSLKKLEEQAEQMQNRSKEAERQSSRYEDNPGDNEILKKATSTLTRNLQRQIQLLRSWYRHAYYTYALFYSYVTSDYVQYARKRNKELSDS